MLCTRPGWCACGARYGRRRKRSPAFADAAVRSCPEPGRSGAEPGRCGRGKRTPQARCGPRSVYRRRLDRRATSNYRYVSARCRGRVRGVASKKISKSLRIRLPPHLITDARRHQAASSQAQVCNLGSCERSWHSNQMHTTYTAQSRSHARSPDGISISYRRHTCVDTCAGKKEVTTFSSACTGIDGCQAPPAWGVVLATPPLMWLCPRVHSAPIPVDGRSCHRMLGLPEAQLGLDRS